MAAPPTEILLFLLVAAGIGALVGWLVAWAAGRRRVRSLSGPLDVAQEEREALRTALDTREEELEEAIRLGDRARAQIEESERDLTVILGERDRALTRAVSLQEEVEALAEAFRERDDRVRDLQRQLGAAGSSTGASQEVMRLRAERDRLKRRLDERSS